MNRVFLVACVAAKQDVPAAAKDLYTSEWFKKARRYAEQEASVGRWYVISAKHGLTEPEKVLEPYNLTLKTMGRKDRAEWAQRVLGELRKVTDPEQDRIVFLAGKDYREPLATLLGQAGYTVEVPMEGLRIGEQMQWLGAH